MLLVYCHYFVDQQSSHLRSSVSKDGADPSCFLPLGFDLLFWIEINVLMIFHVLKLPLYLKCCSNPLHFAPVMSSVNHKQHTETCIAVNVVFLYSFCIIIHRDGASV